MSRIRHLNFSLFIHFMEPNIAKEVREFVSTHTSIKNCLKKGLINYSALARLIAEEKKIDTEKNFDAIVVALRRLSENLRPSDRIEKKIRGLLKKSKLEVKTKIGVAVLNDKISLHQLIEFAKDIIAEESDFHLIHGSKTFTIVSSDELVEKIEHIFGHNLISSKTGLVEILLKTRKEIETIPGVMSRLYSSLAEHDVNIIETMSSWTDTLFVIEEKDIQKAMNALNF